tara:strand:- start:886 stop:990 length:105 start_codon:yes stop_codon:yes gene_type:complete
MGKQKAANQFMKKYKGGEKLMPESIESQNEENES